MDKHHTYALTVTWTGNKGDGTKNYRAYERSHTISAAGKPEISASSDPAFRGDSSCYNPEELFLAAISGCHMLWFLHLCAEKGILVSAYTDKPTGTMIETETGSGRFEEVTLHPEVTLTHAEPDTLIHSLHQQANQLCFIANSVNFKITHKHTVKLLTPQNL